MYKNNLNNVFKVKKSGKQGVFFTCLMCMILFFSCEKWVDPKPKPDPRLTNPYCNDPDAVNYNWGFPGKPDNTICYYPSDLFKGKFVYQDSIYAASGVNMGLFLMAQTDTLIFTQTSHSKLTVSGFCSKGGTIVNITAVTFNATIDTTVGDSLTATMGQLLCRNVDTLNGTIFFSRIDSMLHINLMVVSDTGSTSHVGKAKKI